MQEHTAYMFYIYHLPRYFDQTSLTSSVFIKKKLNITMKQAISMTFEIACFFLP